MGQISRKYLPTGAKCTQATIGYWYRHWSVWLFFFFFGHFWSRDTHTSSGDSSLSTWITQSTGAPLKSNHVSLGDLTMVTCVRWMHTKYLSSAQPMFSFYRPFFCHVCLTRRLPRAHHRIISQHSAIQSGLIISISLAALYTHLHLHG